MRSIILLLAALAFADCGQSGDAAQQQNRSDTEPIGDFRFSRDRSALFSAHPDNIFLVKATYWIAF
jgi:hypothetical protein